MPSKLPLIIVALVAPLLPIITWLPLTYYLNFSSLFVAYSILGLASLLGALSVNKLSGKVLVGFAYFLAAMPLSWIFTLFGACYFYNDCL